MAENILNDISHRRYNPLRGCHILVSPHRNKRPWQGLQEEASKTTLPKYDPECYLCPGNKRAAAGEENPQYEKPFIFVNDYSAVKEDQKDYEPETQENDLSSRLLQAHGVAGRCYVLTFSPSHNVTLADLSPTEILPIIHTWTSLYTSHLSSESPLLEAAKLNPVPEEPFESAFSAPKSQFKYMQIFENKGTTMGCSNPHPHGQVWVTSRLPEEPTHELEQLQKYRRDHDGAHLLVDYAGLESSKKERTIWENPDWIVVCPWWAIWPFELMIIPKRHKRALVDLDEKERLGLSEAISEVTRRYDNLFETQFPYSMGIHQAPLVGTAEEIEASHLHFHFYPPLLRSATVRKFQVGYEMMAEPQRDITPEQAAERLRNCGGELYRRKLEAKEA